MFRSLFTVACFLAILLDLFTRPGVTTELTYKSTATAALFSLSWGRGLG